MSNKNTPLPTLAASLRAVWPLVLGLVFLGAWDAFAQGTTPPTISGFSPTSGPVGTTVVINGTNFIPPLSIIFAGNAAAAGSFTSTTITVTVPSGAETGPIVVNASGGQASTAAPFTVAAAATPMITSVLTASGSLGQPFSYQITAKNNPTSFGATNLPLGLSVDTASGLITGTPIALGTSAVTLSATNDFGADMQTLTLTIADFPVATLAVTTPTVTVGSGNDGEFTVTLSAAQTGDVTVAYTIKGTAINGTDYALLKGTVKVKAGKTSRPIKVTPMGNLEGASKVTVKLTLAPGTGYTVGTTAPLKVKILAAGS